MGRHPNNKVWEYFDFITDNIAKCRSCKAKLSTPGKSRGNMVRHLFTLHGINMYTAGQNRGLVMEKIPSRRGREFHESLNDGEKNVFRRFKNGVSIDSNSLDFAYSTESNVALADDEDESHCGYNDKSNNVSQHEDNIQVLNEVETPTLKVPLVITKPQEIHKEENEYDDIDANAQDDNEEVNVSLNDPLINLNVEPLEPRTACSTSDIDNRHPHNPQPYISSSNILKQHQVSTSDTQNYLEKLQAEALTEKLKAEARYFNELAELTRSKRIFVDLQCRKLRNQLKNPNLK